MTEGQMSIPEKETFGFFDKIGENTGISLPSVKNYTISGRALVNCNILQGMSRLLKYLHKESRADLTP